jgi:mitogen-activated protein kinase 15
MSSQSSTNFLEGHILRRFSVLKKVGSGAYGHVWKVEEKTTRKVFALKKIFDAFQHATDAQRTYREMEILRQLEHPNIIKLYETIRADNNKDVYLLFEYMEADLHNVIAEGILKDVHVRFILYQMAKALKYLHSAKLIHRDLKPSNILVNSNCAIKLCDFGLVRSLNSSLLTAVLTEGVATRWYRSPEVLLGSKSYSTPADVWSFGCIIYEILAQKPLFAGSCTMDQIEKICSFTGYPTEEDITSLESEMSRSLIKEMKVPSGCSPSAFLKDFNPLYADLLQRILVFNPKKRMTIEDILQHEIVKEFHKP